MRSAERVVAFYNQRGTAEQWIKEGIAQVLQLLDQYRLSVSPLSAW